MISERGIEVSKAGGSCRIYENWQMVEGEDSCQCLLATGESTLGEAGLHCLLFSSRNWLAGLFFDDFTVLGASQHTALSKAAEVILPSREFRSPGPGFGRASAECNMVLLVQRHKLVSDGLVWSGQSACSNPFPFPVWCFFAFFSLAG